ncbi:MAG: glycosyltransferase family 2 protein [Thermoanaerobaculaceae bacterium]|nr:glycosyltransferase family 2 protein [Thermoanaerobaculaceae bacterium]MDI9620551.1 glycosyltransferase family 2 protein [Acidobacteriota bacterium]NLH11928.1 glycosyltransferase family 2 protein [Holophagae bacterium]HPW55210.1 glycosyltransferase family 2 protein [Thermoanaerobaculaceae bacterium]
MTVAAIVVNYNGGEDLRRCLAALAAQTVPLAIVLVDCASTDGSRALAECPPAGVVGVPLPDNRGYTGGANAGLEALGPSVRTVGFFNPDCFPTSGFFAAACGRLAEPGIGGVAGRLERPGGEQLDSCGQVLTPWLLRVRDRGYSEPAAGAYQEAARVLAACGAGMVYHRDALAAVAVGGRVFPDEFFAFWEDVDLGWRVNAAGWRVVYEPAAVAVHRRGGTAEPGSGRLLFRRPPAVAAGILVNRWATWLRNLAAVDFWPRLPVLLPADAMVLLLVGLRRPAVWSAVVRALPRLRTAWRQRPLLRRQRLRDLR